MKPKSKLALFALFLLLASIVLSACASRAATSEMAPEAPVEMEMPAAEAGAPARDAGSGAYDSRRPPDKFRAHGDQERRSVHCC